MLSDFNQLQRTSRYVNTIVINVYLRLSNVKLRRTIIKIKIYFKLNALLTKVLKLVADTIEKSYPIFKLLFNCCKVYENTCFH